jgi:outer membrane protein W
VFRFAGFFAACLAASACAAQARDNSPSFWSRALTAINDTTPAGLKPQAERGSGWSWFGDQWDSGKTLVGKSRMNLFLPGFTLHPAPQFDNHEEQNAYPYGAGIASHFIDAKDNERMVYALAFSDSHYNIEPMVGYAWVARWPLFGPIKGGIGYTALITARNDTQWLPVPGVVPLVSLGTDEASLYAVYIPTQNVTFVFARLSTDAFSLGASPGAVYGKQTRRNLLFAGYGYVNTDFSGIDGIAGTNGGAPVFGYRRFFGDNIAAELSVERSTHDMSVPPQTVGSFERTAYTLTGQYHFPVAERLQLYGGVGLAYEHLSQQQFVDASLESSSVGPVIQGGFNFDLTSFLTLTGGIRTGFPRFQLTQNGVPGGSVLPAPVTFSLALGARF